VQFKCPSPNGAVSINSKELEAVNEYLDDAFSLEADALFGLPQAISYIRDERIEKFSRVTVKKANMISAFIMKLRHPQTMNFHH
jgi:hypothetical protein